MPNTHRRRRRDSTVELRRRCVRNSQLVGDSLDESEQICRWLSGVADVKLVIERSRVRLPPLHCRVAYVNSAFHPSAVGKLSTGLLAVVKAGRRVHLYRVAGNTVWSHMASDFR